jgi:hypothetical protein
VEAPIGHQTARCQCDAHVPRCQRRRGMVADSDRPESRPRFRDQPGTGPSPARPIPMASCGSAARSRMSLVEFRKGM